MEFLILIAITAFAFGFVRAMRRAPTMISRQSERRVSPMSRAQALRAEREWYRDMARKGGR